MAEKTLISNLLTNRKTIFIKTVFLMMGLWAHQDLNLGPPDYE